MHVVPDVNVLIGGLEASGRPGVPPTAEQFARTAAGRLFHLAWKGKPLLGDEPVVLLFSKHILDVFGHVADRAGLCDRKTATAWLVNLIAQLPNHTWAIDTTAEDYRALRARAEATDGVRDAFGNPDTEDEAILRLCAAHQATLVTFERDELLPTTARRRGITVVPARNLTRQLSAA